MEPAKARSVKIRLRSKATSSSSLDTADRQVTTQTTSPKKLTTDMSVNELINFINCPRKNRPPAATTTNRKTALNTSMAVPDQEQQKPSTSEFNKLLNSKINYAEIVKPDSSNNISSTTLINSSRKRIDLLKKKNLPSTSKSSTSKSSAMKSSTTKSAAKASNKVTKCKNLDSALANAVTTPKRSSGRLSKELPGTNGRELKAVEEREDSHSGEKRKRSPSPAVDGPSDNQELQLPKFEFKFSTPTPRRSIKNFRIVSDNLSGEKKEANNKSADKSKSADKEKEDERKEAKADGDKGSDKEKGTVGPEAQEKNKDAGKDRLREIVVCNKAYQIVKKLGEGGSCSVYYILDNSVPSSKPPKDYALKIVNLLKHDKVIIQGFKEEINTLKRLKDCKRVVQLYEHEFRRNSKNEHKYLFIIMEKGDHTFETLIKEARGPDGKLELFDIRYFWREMLKCVEEIHAKGIVHSDLKPANFILVRGRMKIIDFGISKQIELDHTSVFNEAIIGSVDFMAPETVTKMDVAGQRGVKYNQKSDVWSLGIILYYLAYNKTPFEGFQKFIKYNCVKDGSVEYPNYEHQEVIDLLKFILKKEPMKRPTVEELLKHPFCR